MLGCTQQSWTISEKKTLDQKALGTAAGLTQWARSFTIVRYNLNLQE